MVLFRLLLPQAKRSAEAGLRPELRGAGYLFSWGSGASGCLGHGDTKDRSTPKVSRNAVTREWSGGLEARSSRGMDDARLSSCLTVPRHVLVHVQVIDALRGQHVIEVACGMVHSLAVVGTSEVKQCTDARARLL